MFQLLQTTMHKLFYNVAQKKLQVNAYIDKIIRYHNKNTRITKSILYRLPSLPKCKHKRITIKGTNSNLIKRRYKISSCVTDYIYIYPVYFKCIDDFFPFISLRLDFLKSHLLVHTEVFLTYIYI